MIYIIPPIPVLQIVAHIQLNATENTCRILQDLKIVLLVHKVFTLFLYSLPQSLLYWQSYYLVYVILVEFDIVTGVYCIFIMASYILKFMVGSIRTSVIYSITMRFSISVNFWECPVFHVLFVCLSRSRYKILNSGIVKEKYLQYIYTSCDLSDTPKIRNSNNGNFQSFSHWNINQQK